MNSVLFPLAPLRKSNWNLNLNCTSTILLQATTRKLEVITMGQMLIERKLIPPCKSDTKNLMDD